MALPTKILLLSSALITCLCALQSIAALRPQQQHQQQQPPVYVIQDEHPLKSSSSEPKSWNNQRLTLRGSQSPRSAKQLHWGGFGNDEPVPFYHSYKYMGLGIGEGSWADKYHQPLQRNHYMANELPYLAAPGAGPPAQQQQQVAQQAPKTSHQRAGAGGTGATKGIKGAPRKSLPSPPSTRRVYHHEPAHSATDLSGPVSRPQQNRTQNRAGGGTRKNLVCYYGTWAVYRPDAGRYPVENIDPFLCTHIIYGFTGLSYDNQIKPLDPWNDLEDNYGKGAMKRFTNLKRINPDLKTLVAIGGWNEGSIKYSKMASEPEARAKFVQSVVDFLRKYNFDGLDLDWEYPGARGGHSYDKENFVRLLRELNQAFKPDGYLLTAAVSAGKWFIEPAYNIAEVSKYLDLINLMAYDYHGGWESKTGMNAPLFHSPKYDTKGDDALLNVNWSVNYWLQQGASPDKLMLGVGSYGRSFTLDKANVNGINAPANQKGQAGPYTREPGSLGYNEICESFQRQPQSWTIVRDPDYLAPYAYNDRQWVGYDDMQSLALKAEYAKSMGLGGMMMWSIETDDFQGRCHNEKYPLLNTLKRALQVGPGNPVAPTPTSRPPTAPAGTSPATSTTRRPATATPQTQSSTTPAREIEDDEPAQGSSSSTTTTSTRRPLTTARVVPGSTRKPSTTTTTTSSTTRPPTRPTTTATGDGNSNNGGSGGGGTNNGSEFVCRADGMFADPRNCRKFIRCVSSGGRAYSIYRFDCGPGTAFNEQQQYCDHIYNVPNCSASSRSSANTLGRHALSGPASSRYHHHHQSRILGPLTPAAVPLAQPLFVFG